MDKSFSYTSIAEAKNGSKIPLREAISFHSKYNPDREGEQFAAQCTDASAHTFFIVLGLCGNENTIDLLKASVVATIVVPVLIWAYSFIYRLLKRGADSRQEAWDMQTEDDGADTDSH